MKKRKKKYLLVYQEKNPGILRWQVNVVIIFISKGLWFDLEHLKLLFFQWRRIQLINILHIESGIKFEIVFMYGQVINHNPIPK